MKNKKILIGIVAVVVIILTIIFISNSKNNFQNEIADEIPSQNQQAQEENDLAFNLPPDQDSVGWTQTTGPLGGTVIRMIPHENTIWASLYSGGIYELQLDDSWKQIAIGRGIPENRAFDIVADSSDVNIAYVPEMIAGLARTNNKGSSWQGLRDYVTRDIEADIFHSHTLALDPENPKILYVPGFTNDENSILIVSIDGGERWEKRFVFDKYYDFNHIYFYNSKMYIATHKDGVLVSSDKGKSWEQFNDGLENLKTARFVNFKNTLYLLGAELQFNARMGGELYKLSSNELSWEKVDGLEQVTGIGADENYFYAATWNPDPKIWISNDGNLFSETASENLPPAWIGEVVSFDSKIYVGIGGNGIYVSSDNGNTFEELNQGLISIATREVYVNPLDENEIYVGTWDRQGFYWSKNGGKGYKRLATDLNVFTLLPDPHNFSIVYLGGDGFFKGTLGEKSSAFIQKNKPESMTSASAIKSIAVDPKNSDHILIGIGDELGETPSGKGLWESYNQGETWTRATGIGNFAVYSIIFNPDNPSIVYASALGEGVFKSSDGGRHFNSLGDERFKYTYRLAMSSSDPEIIVASSNVFFGQLSLEEQLSGKYGGIFQSKDGGETWTELTAGVRNYGDDQPENFIGWLYNFGHMPNYEMVLIDPKDANHLIVGHHAENVVETIDGGATWKKAGAEEMVPGGIHNYAYCLGSSSDFKKFYACTCGRGMFSGILCLHLRTRNV
ncbi:hypothetical protein HYS72_00645 [Candidatus Pacearchaeota archaeon]|nr:hypothetical protein [Candidatus Pacearchaeota archaeon]